MATHLQIAPEAEAAGPPESSGPRYDVFLSYNRDEKEAVKRIAMKLKRLGLEPWLDELCLTPGMSWQDELGAGLRASASCAAFLGPHGFGDWAREEVGVAQDRAVKDRTFRVFPVLLPGLPEPFAPDVLPPFLRMRSWVDLRGGFEDPRVFQRLVNGIKGVYDGGEPVEPRGDVCPYRGLEAFDREHHEFFFGREREIQRLVEMLKGSRLLAVLGPSGSGKSSLVRAGLIPALENGGMLPGSEAWTVRVFRPGSHPLTALAAQLVQLFPGQAMQSTLDRMGEDPRSLHLAASLAQAGHPGRRVVWVVDQLEEVFAQKADERERAAFFGNLLYAATIPDGPGVVVLTMRADFYWRCASYPELAESISSHQFLVGPMDSLRQAIEGPAHLVGLEFEAGLVDTILEDVERQPGALPLLEHALLELWDERRGLMLTLEGYRESGGVQGAIAHRADDIFRGLDPPRQEIMRRILVVRLTAGEEADVTRRRATIAELAARPEEREAVEAVVDALVRARLLTAGSDEQTGERWVEVAHEALIRGWPRLQQWIDEDRAGLRVQRRLTAAAQAWQESNRAEGLYTGRRLKEAREWGRENEAGLNELEREFLAAGIRAEAAERRKRWGMRAGTAAAGVAVVLAGVVFALWLRERRLAWVNGVLSAAESAADPLVAALLLAELPADREPPRGAAVARRVADQRVPLAVLRAPPGGRLRGAALSPDGSRAATVYEDGTVWSSRADGRGDPVLLAGHGAAVVRASYSRDGSRLVTASEDGTARVWPARGGGEPLVLQGHRATVRVAVFSRDGTRVLTASDDSTARLWDALDGHPVQLFAEPEGPVQAAAISEDGSRVATGSGGGAVRVWPVGRPGESLLLGRHGDGVLSVEISRDGSRVLSAALDGTARVWPADGSGPGVELGRHDGAVWSASFSPDGSRVVTVSGGTAWISPADGSRAPIPLRGHTGAVRAASFSPDGSRVVTASADGTARLWRAHDGREVAVLRSHGGEVFLAAFAAAGSRLVTAAADNVARVWPAVGEDPVLLQGHRGPAWSVAFSPDGSRLVTAGEDGTTRVWRTDGAGPRVVLPARAGRVLGAELSPDGTRVVAASDSVAWVLSADGRGTPLVLQGHRGAVSSAAFSPDGSRVVTASDDRTARVWRLDGTHEPAVVLSGHRGWVASAAFSRDGSRIVTASGDGTARVWRTDRKSRAVELRGHTGPVVAAAFDPRGARVVTASSDSTARVWRADGRGEAVELRGHAGPVRSASFDADGSRVVTTSDDGTARVWSADRQGEVIVLHGHGGPVRRAEFSHDGTYVVTASADGSARVWRADGTGEPVVLHADGAVQDARFSPDGTRVAAASASGAVQLWRVGWRGLVERLRASTTACLRPQERARLLQEPPEKARRAFARCERAHHRAAASQRTTGESP